MLVTTLLFAVSAQAEDSTFAGTVAKTDDPPETETHLTAEAGGTYTSGNSAFYAVSAIAKADHTWKVRNKVSGFVGFNFGGSKSDADGDGFLYEEEREGPLE